MVFNKQESVISSLVPSCGQNKHLYLKTDKQKFVRYKLRKMTRLEVANDDILVFSFLSDSKDCNHDQLWYQMLHLTFMLNVASNVMRRLIFQENILEVIFHPSTFTRKYIKPEITFSKVPSDSSNLCLIFTSGYRI